MDKLTKLTAKATISVKEKPTPKKKTKGKHEEPKTPEAKTKPVENQPPVTKVAVVTNGDRGLGAKFIEKISPSVLIVYLVTCDMRKGQETMEVLNKKSINNVELVKADDKNLAKLQELLKTKHNGLDILLNYCGVLLQDYYKTSREEADKLFEFNTSNVLLSKRFLFPVLKNDAIVINLTGHLGHVSELNHLKDILRPLMKLKLSTDDVITFIKKYIETNSDADQAMSQTQQHAGVKVATSALTHALQQEYPNVRVLALHPEGFDLKSMDDSRFVLVYLTKIALKKSNYREGVSLWFDNKSDPTECYTYDKILKLYEHFNSFGNFMKICCDVEA